MWCKVAQFHMQANSAYKEVLYKEVSRHTTVLHILFIQALMCAIRVKNSGCSDKDQLMNQHAPVAISQNHA